MDKSRKIDTFPQPFPSEKEKLNRWPFRPNNPLDSYYITENVDKELENTYKNYPDYVPVYLCNHFYDIKSGQDTRFSLEYTPDSSYKDIMYVLKRNGINLFFISEDLKTPEICLEAVKSDGYALQYVPEHLRSYDLCLEAVKSERSALHFVPEEIKKEILALESSGKLPYNTINANPQLTTMKKILVPKNYTIWEFISAIVKQGIMYRDNIQSVVRNYSTIYYLDKYKKWPSDLGIKNVNIKLLTAEVVKKVYDENYTFSSTSDVFDTEMKGLLDTYYDFWNSTKIEFTTKFTNAYGSMQHIDYDPRGERGYWGDATIPLSIYYQNMPWISIETEYYKEIQNYYRKVYKELGQDFFELFENPDRDMVEMYKKDLKVTLEKNKALLKEVLGREI